MAIQSVWHVIVILTCGTLVSSEAPYAATAADKAASFLMNSTQESAKEDALEEAALTEAAMQDDGSLAGIADPVIESSVKDALKEAMPTTDAVAPKVSTSQQSTAELVASLKKATDAKEVLPAKKVVPAKEGAPPKDVPAAKEVLPAQQAAAPVKKSLVTVRPHLRGQAVASESNISTAQPLAQSGNSSVPTSVASVLGSDSMPSIASGMEKAITDLVLGKASLGFGATPFGKSVGQITDLIEKDMMPKVLAAHTANQQELDKLMSDIKECSDTKDVGIAKADKKKALYLKMSPMHKTCRSGEGGAYTAKQECNSELRDKQGLMKLKCKEFAFVYKKYGDQNANRQIVKKGGSEHTESYLKRITSTVCGKYPPGGLGGGGKNGFLDVYMVAKEACHRATHNFNVQEKKCKRITKEYFAKKATCDNLQDQMDGAACKRAIGMKDACETYAECYYDKKKVYDGTETMVKVEAKDRQAEWRGLKRMQCLMKSFDDGKVSAKEVDTCKKKTIDVAHLVIRYPPMPELATCKVPERYPTTAEYKLAEFAMLPAVAKGKADANECTGVVEISTKPAKKSPKSCKCERMTLNGPYSPGPLVRCSNCLEVRRSLDTNSCPFGTKIFSPQSASDWKTIFSSVGKLANPYFIVDVTRPQNSCGGCTKKPMHSGTSGQGHYWHTSDGSPWWLRSTTFKEPNGNYHSNCYLAMFKPWNADNIRFDDDGCKFSAKSYYCQLKHVSTTPKRGSPPSCKCEKLSLTGTYSAGALVECRGCWKVSKSTQRNSCPMGTKLFSPANLRDWSTVLASAKPLRSPHWIVDITRPQNGCGGCTRNAMNSRNPAQGTWRTSDGSPWFLRSTRYSEPNGDYYANCYMDLSKTPVNEHSVVFNDARCKYSSNAYYCQPVRRR